MMISIIHRRVFISYPLYLLALAALIVGLTGCRQSDSARLTIATAANVQFAMAELKHAFEVKTQTQVDVILGSSGKLSAQIAEGAPYDVFVSADRKYPQALFEKGIGLEPPVDYARGSLVLWTTREEFQEGLTVETLTRPEVRKIAMANPQLAPYGIAAEQVLRHYDYYEPLKKKLVFGESISQTSQYIQSQSADLGFTAKAVVLSEKVENQGEWIELPAITYAPIHQAVLLLNKDERSRTFYNFLQSEEAQAIFQRYGYLLPE